MRIYDYDDDLKQDMDTISLVIQDLEDEAKGRFTDGDKAREERLMSCAKDLRQVLEHYYANHSNV